MREQRRTQKSPWVDGWPEIHDQAVRDAFLRVPRREFVAPSLAPYATQDEPLPIGAGQTISQPFVVALMSQALAVGPGMRVLEIGAGSGFQTAILCELTKIEDQRPGASVWAVERHQSLADAAIEILRRKGYDPHIRVGDGAAGWPEAAPYDRILVAAAAPAIPRPLWEQLAEGGRMVIPVGRATDREDAGGQFLWLLIKQEGRMVGNNLGAVRFVPLVSPLLDDPANWFRPPDQPR